MIHDDDDYVENAVLETPVLANEISLVMIVFSYDYLMNDVMMKMMTTMSTMMMTTTTIDGDDDDVMMENGYSESQMKNETI